MDQPSSTFADLIGRHLDTWTAAGGTLRSLGAAVDLDPSNLSHMRAGRQVPSHEVLARLCDELRLDTVQVRELFAAAGRVLPGVLLGEAA